MTVIKQNGGVSKFAGIEASGTLGWLTGTLGDTDGGGEIFAVRKPKHLRGKGLYIYHLWTNVTTAPTGGSLGINFGQTTDATTNSNNIAGGVNCGIVIVRNTAVTPVPWDAANDWITLSRNTGAAAGLKGNIFIGYREIDKGQNAPTP